MVIKQDLFPFPSITFEQALLFKLNISKFVDTGHVEIFFTWHPKFTFNLEKG
jgi:hypothetical protein